MSSESSVDDNKLFIFPAHFASFSNIIQLQRKKSEMSRFLDLKRCLSKFDNNDAIPFEADQKYLLKMIHQTINTSKVLFYFIQSTFKDIYVLNFGTGCYLP